MKSNNFYIVDRLRYMGPNTVTGITVGKAVISFDFINQFIFYNYLQLTFILLSKIIKLINESLMIHVIQ